MLRGLVAKRCAIVGRRPNRSVVRAVACLRITVPNLIEVCGVPRFAYLPVATRE